MLVLKLFNDQFFSGFATQLEFECDIGSRRGFTTLSITLKCELSVTYLSQYTDITECCYPANSLGGVFLKFHAKI